MYIDKLNNIVSSLLNNYKTNLSNIIDKLNILNPLNALKRGYSIVKKDEKLVSLKDINKNDCINIQMLNGTIVSEVKEVKIDA